jgi:hypothetical protein
LREWAVARLRHRRSHFGCPHLRSRPFAWSGRRRIDGAIRCRQLRAITFRRTTRPTPFQRRGCGLLVDLLGPWGAFTRPCRPSDVLIVTRRHARPASVPTDALSASRSSRMVRLRLTCEPKDLCIALPVRARRTSAREHLPSYREPASFHLQAEPARTFNRECSSAYRFAVSRLVPHVRWCFELPSG